MPARSRVLDEERPYMKALMVIGVVLLLLGILSFLVPIPSYHHHGVTVGDSHIGVTTEEQEKLPPAVGISLVVVGAIMMISARKA